MRSISSPRARVLSIIAFLAALFVTAAALSGCVQEVINSGENADLEPENIQGYPDTLEKRGMAVPCVVEITPKDGYFGPECGITVIFNEKMDRESVEEKFRIYDANDYPYHGKFIWGAISNSDRVYFDFVPLKQLITGHYRVILFEGARSAGNIEMTERFTSSFDFKPVPEGLNLIKK